MIQTSPNNLNVLLVRLLSVSNNCLTIFGEMNNIRPSAIINIDIPRKIISKISIFTTCRVSEILKEIRVRLNY